ncbi:outer dynein arm-docking complex subunit 4-like isoform X2 [Mytilus californianus]|uniref:outer dynein arm-docking complex subunit 4-like isoform X2 n=1 Tax=Mytilus californianus TaxID=6549 RepID=UPI002245D431|nr:outer dynein arm-docking complex subunit 4-like isoform X2 [Mytilus californianus]
MFDGDEDGPKGTFEIYKAEADSLFKQGEYRKSIESYTTALELLPHDKNCLVCRSKCHLQLGDTISALEDAELSLAEDNTFHKGVYQKAQALYYQGDFEMSLVFYHRGHKLRPELQEFRLGIQKAQEAIDNSVGSPEKVKLTTEGDLTFFAQQDEKKPKKQQYSTYKKTTTQAPKRRQYDPSRPVGSEKTIKQLLGELYGDRQYLEKLLKETDSRSEVGKVINNLVTEGLSYLDTRTDFWRQQKPMYARKHERAQQRNRTDTHTGKLAPNDYIIRELEKIDIAQVEGEYQEALRRSQRCLNTVNSFTAEQVPNKIEVLANLNSCIGNAYLEMGQYDKSLEHHNIDLSMGEDNDMEEAVSRGLDNLGRVHARHGNFEKAVQVWEKKLPMSKSALESTWLYHEIGRCYLEIGQFETAKENGEKSKVAAEEAEDQMWQLQASVLVAQSEVKLGDLSAALTSFDTSLELAKSQGDMSAQSAIKKAMDDVNKKIAKGNTSTSAKKERVKIDEEGEREIQTAVSSQRAEEEKEENETNNAKETSKKVEEESEKKDEEKPVTPRSKDSDSNKQENLNETTDENNESKTEELENKEESKDEIKDEKDRESKEGET